MHSNRTYANWRAINAAGVSFTLGNDRQGKPTVQIQYEPTQAEVCFVSSAAVTLWPRVNGDGNFGTMWGPTDIAKAKYTLDLTDTKINGEPNHEFEQWRQLMDQIDDKLLAFVTENQVKLLGRRNLSIEEVKMLQIRSIRPKYDKITGALNGHTINLTTPKYAHDGMGGKYSKVITVCDCTGQVVPGGVVCPGDVVAITMFANQVYTGVGGDKFGIHWSFEDVAVICQRSALEVKTSVSAFGETPYAFAKPYSEHSFVSEHSPQQSLNEQFQDENASPNLVTAGA